jgi:hypothetical protein
MPFTMHTDPQFAGDLIQIAKVAQSLDVSQFWYPPLLYYIFKVYQGIALGSSSIIQSAINGINNPALLISNPAIFRTLFILKFLYIGFDFGIAILLWKLFQRPTDQKLALGLWLFNPIVIYVAYVHGQFDMLPLFFIVLAIYLAKNEHLYWAAFLLGIAGCLKNYPLLFLIPFVIVLGKTVGKRIVLLILGTFPYLVLMLPYLHRYSTSFGTFSNWFFKAGYDLGFGAQVYFFLIFYAVLAWYHYYRHAHAFEDFWHACFAILLVYLQFSYFDVHYWVWLIPFAIIYWVEYPSKATPIYLIIGICLLVLTAPTPIARFLAPISPRFFLRLPTLMEALNPYLPMLFITNVVRSLLAGTCFFLTWLLVWGMPTTRPEATLPTPDQEVST